MIDYFTNKMYGWVETEQTWRIIDQSQVYAIGVGERGRLLKTDYENEKVFQ